MVATRRTRSERLVDYLLDGGANPLAAELVVWLAASGRFRNFAETHRDKIRKKLRGARDADAVRDVRAELRVACLLLGDRNLELVFEAYGARQRGPDFAVTHRGHRFNLEVTRLRQAPSADAVARPLLAKLLQLPTGAPNVLLLEIDGSSADTVDVASTWRELRATADRKDEAFFASRGFKGTRDFYDRFLRLGAVVIWSEAATGEGRAAAWENPSGRIPVPNRAVRACLACLRAA